MYVVTIFFAIAFQFLLFILLLIVAGFTVAYNQKKEIRDYLSQVSLLSDFFTIFGIASMIVCFFLFPVLIDLGALKLWLFPFALATFSIIIGVLLKRHHQSLFNKLTDED